MSAKRCPAENLPQRAALTAGLSQTSVPLNAYPTRLCALAQGSCAL